MIAPDFGVICLSRGLSRIMTTNGELQPGTEIGLHLRALIGQFPMTSGTDYAIRQINRPVGE